MSETTARLTPQQIEGRLVAALATVRGLWDDMIPTPTVRLGRTSRGGALLDDTATDDHDMPRIVRVIEARHEVTAVLNAWCRAVIEDHRVQHGIPGGHDVPGMCGFLTRWSHLMAEHEAAEVLLEEVADCAAKVRRHAEPQRPEGLRLGACPLVWQHPDTADDQSCPGRLHGTDDGWIRCDACGTLAVAAWWEEQMWGEQGAPMMTAEQLVTWLHRQYGLVVQPATVRQWVRRGDLARSGTDEQGRSLYDRWAVETCLQRRARRAG